MAKVVTIKSRTIPAQPRSARLRGRVAGTVMTAASSVATAAGGGEGGHSHQNLSDLDRLGVDAPYVEVDGQKAHAAQADKAVELTADSPTRAEFVKRLADDTVEGKLTFKKAPDFTLGATLGQGGSVGSGGEAVFETVASPIGFFTDKGQYTLGAFIAGISGGCFWTDEQGRTHLECDIATVRQKMEVRQIEVQEVTHVGGAQIISPAGGRCVEVEEKRGKDGTLEGYWCYFTASDAPGEPVTHDITFRPGDLAFCQQFNGTAVRRWWRRVVDTGEEDETGRTYILVSATDCENGSAIPAAGDAIVTMGSATDPDRRNVIAMASYGSGSPLIAQLFGIDTYRITTDNIGTIISPNGNIFRGSFIAAASGKSLEDIIKDGDAAIRLLVEGAGINLTDKTITIDADHLFFRNSDGKVVGMFDGGKFRTEFIDVANLVARRVLAGDVAGQRVEIDPDKKTVTIADADGRRRTVLSGAIYHTAAAVLGEGEKGTVTFSSRSIDASDSSAALLAPAPVSLSKSVEIARFSTEEPTMIVFDSGTLAINARAQHTINTIGGGSGGQTMQPADFPSGIQAEANAGLWVDTFADEGYTQWRHSARIAGGDAASTSGEDGCANVDNNIIDLSGLRCRIPSGGYHRVYLSADITVCGNGSAASASVQTPQGRYLNDLSCTFYYANGWTVGANAENYAAAFADSAGRINLEVLSDGYGHRVTPAGIYSRHHNGAWLPAEQEIFHGYYVPDAAGTVSVFGEGTWNGRNTAAKRNGVGECRISFPGGTDALGLYNSNLRVCVCPIGKGTAASVYMDAKPDSITVYTTRGSSEADVPFTLSVSKIS